jgi:hypothetical protein
MKYSQFLKLLSNFLKSPESMRSMENPHNDQVFSAILNTFLLKCRDRAMRQREWENNSLGLANRHPHHTLSIAISQAFNEITQEGSQQALQLASYLLQGADLPIVNAAMVTQAQKMGEI